MLLRRDILERIQSGEVSLAFRRWKRPTVKSGGTLKTRIGVLAIESVEKVSLRSITEEQARAAGSPDRKSLLHELSSREGEVHRISLKYVGDDPRLALRDEVKISPAEMDDICARLDRYDAASRRVPWTYASLSIIAKQPLVSARILSADLDMERLWFKTNIRKLKSLGLTISHSPGYELSPRGKKVLAAMKRKRTKGGRTGR